MDPSRKGEYRIANIAMVLLVICLALMTWAQLADVDGAPGWAPVASVASTVFLGLSTLTQCPRRAALMRLLTGTWIIAAPHLFGFSQVAPTFWVYLVIGVFVVATSLSGVPAVYEQRLGPSSRVGRREVSRHPI